MLKPVLFAAAMATLSSAAMAQAPESPIGHSGPVIAYADDSVTLEEKGKPVTVAMTRGWSVATTRTVRADMIRPGDFIASIFTDIDATLGRATEARLFEAGYRPEIGAHAMPQPGMSIIHGTVASSTQTSAGQVVDVVYPGGARTLILPPEVKVVASDLQDRALVKPGVRVGAVTRRGADNVWRAGRLVIATP
jgi:hypothetical protein